jgi:hypothetical protein
MRNPIQAIRRDTTTTTAPAAELTIPAGRRPEPTQTRLRTLRVPVAVYVLALLVIPGMVVLGFMSAGLWATTGTSSSAQAGTGSADGGGNAVAPAAPADVKGSMTVQQVVDAFPAVTAAQVLAQFNAPPSTPTSAQLKELVEASDGMDIPALRTWLEKQTP